MTLSITRTNTYMLACEVPLLKNQNLCEFLSTMDEEERTALATDQKKFKEASDLFYKENRVSGILSKTSFGLASLSTGAGFIMTATAPLGKEGIGLSIALSSMVIGMVGAMGAFDYIKSESSFLNTLNSTINDERICRLQQKIRKIEKALTEQAVETEKEQCQTAKDFFRLKEIEMTSSKTNQITVRHQYV